MEADAEKKGSESGGFYAPQPATESLDLAMYERIRTEGMTHGKAMEFESALADGIGPRLTGSPNMKRANQWTRDTLEKIGLQNAHIEDWGEFGMGWYQINAWGRIVTPDPEPIWMQAAVWSAATQGPVSGEIVYLPLADSAELDAVQGHLKGKIVLLGAPRLPADLDQPLFFRYTDEELKELEGDKEPRPPCRTSTSERVVPHRAAADRHSSSTSRQDVDRGRSFRSSPPAPSRGEECRHWIDSR